MGWFVTRTTFLFTLFLYVPHLDASAQVRTLRVEVAPGGAQYSLTVSAVDRNGLVEVRDERQVLIQTLTCPLLRGEASPTQPELTAEAEMFVAHFQAEDLDGDGNLDLKGPREFGAKWERDCVWLYHPEDRRFYEDSLAEEMELLYNVTLDKASGRIVAYSIGPTNPAKDEYRIESVSPNRPYWPRLIPTRSCFLLSEAGSPYAESVTVSYDTSPPRVKRRRLRLPAASSKNRRQGELCTLR